MKHGGDVVSFRLLYGHEFLDFSSNINPLGMDRQVVKKIQESILDLEVYPDIHYRKLKEGLSKYLACPIENILVGNGAMELIDAFIGLHDKVLLVHPAFVEYEDRARIYGLEVDNLVLESPFDLGDGEVIRKRIKKNQLVILGNPNNPTGYRIDEQALKKIYEQIKEKEAFLLLDEAFFEFSRMNYDSLKVFSGDYSNLAVLRAATKFFSLPGLRLGYGVTSLEWKEKIEQRLLPWSVNTLAMEVGSILYKLEDYKITSRDFIEGQRQKMFAALKTMPGLKFFESEANYILIKLKDKGGIDCQDFLARKGVLVRLCDNYRGLDDSYIRVAIKNKEDNEYMLAKLMEFLKG